MQRPGEKPLVDRDPRVCGVQGDLAGMEELLRVLPDLTGVSPKREPQTNEVGLLTRVSTQAMRRYEARTSNRTAAQKNMRVFTVD